MKHKFEMVGKGSILCSVDGKKTFVTTGDSITIDEKDDNYSYFINDNKWKRVSDENLGKRNRGNKI